MEKNFRLRSANRADAEQLLNLLKSANFVHRHLDWYTPTYWIGRPPFWIIEENQKIIAALASAPEPHEIAWIRLFISTSGLDPQEHWSELFPKTISAFSGMGIQILVALSTHDWFTQILLRNDFKILQEVVVLRHNGSMKSNFEYPELILRKATPSDLNEITTIDHSAFSPMWQMSPGALAIALEQPYLASIVEFHGICAGYQISTYSGGNVHLARLAVLPEFQNKKIGSKLIAHLLADCMQNHIHLVTVNTQNDNFASLTLYKKMGFIPTGERFPVFRYTKSIA